MSFNKSSNSLIFVSTFLIVFSTHAGGDVAAHKPTHWDKTLRKAIQIADKRLAHKALVNGADANVDWEDSGTTSFIEAVIIASRPQKVDYVFPSSENPKTPSEEILDMLLDLNEGRATFKQWLDENISRIDQPKPGEYRMHFAPLVYIDQSDSEGKTAWVYATQLGNKQLADRLEKLSRTIETRYHNVRQMERITHSPICFFSDTDEESEDSTDTP